MKLPVYDSVNKARLLGHLSYGGSLTASRIEVVFYSKNTVASYHDSCRLGGVNHMPPYRRVFFDVERRSESKSVQDNPAKRTITTVENTVLETKLPLDELCEIENFTPLGGSKASFNEQPKYYRGIMMSYDTYRTVRELERSRTIY